MTGTDYTGWQQLSVSFTPTGDGIVEVTAEAWGGTTYNVWVDDPTIGPNNVSTALMDMPDDVGKPCVNSGAGASARAMIPIGG